MFHKDNVDFCGQLGIVQERRKSKGLRGLTITISIMCSDFFPDGYSSEHSEGDVFSFSKKLAIVVAIVLYTIFSLDKLQNDCILTLTNRAGPRKRWFFFICFECITLKSRRMSLFLRSVRLSSLSSSCVRLAMEPLSSDITAPAARARVARMHSSDLPVRWEYRDVCAISIDPDGW
jgi:hypothetical protein